MSAPAPLWERGAAFRSRVLAGEPVFGTFLAMGSAASAEVCGRSGFDWCLVDLEHGLGGESSLHGELVAVEHSGCAALVRVESGAALRIGRVLDHGAAGVMVPRVRSAQEAEQIVAWARYPPTGVRGVALSARGAGSGTRGADIVGVIDESITILIQIENEAALAQAAQIAAVDGVDVLFVGPNDLTHSMGIPGRFDDPSYLDALGAVAAAARDAGKAAGVMLRSSDEVAALRALGYSFFALSTDAGLLAGTVRAALVAMRGAV